MFYIHLEQLLIMVLFSATETQIQGQTELVVTMEQFGKVLAWFGNLKTDGAGILEKVIYIFILFSFPLMKLRIPLYIYIYHSIDLTHNVIRMVPRRYIYARE